MNDRRVPRREIRGYGEPFIPSYRVVSSHLVCGFTREAIDSLFPPPRRRELTDSSEPDEGLRDNCQALWMDAA